MAEQKEKMIDLKKNIAKDIAYLITQNEITKISKLHQNFRRLYRQAQIPLFGGDIGFEKAFVFVASKHIFEIDLSKSIPFRGMDETEKLYHELLIQDFIPFGFLRRLNDHEIKRLLFLSINHFKCNIVSIAEMKRINNLVARRTQTTEQLKHLTQDYVGYKIIEGVIDGQITSAAEKEIEKIRLAHYFLVPAPSDEEILKTFGWRKLPVAEETVTNIFRIIQEKL
jgi:hypothetical protein